MEIFHYSTYPGNHFTIPEIKFFTNDILWVGKPQFFNKPFAHYKLPHGIAGAIRLTGYKLYIVGFKIICIRPFEVSFKARAFVGIIEFEITAPVAKVGRTAKTEAHLFHAGILL